ncbi:MAG: putative peptidoglycan glycosyltransferase FtsW [Alphaproteobacteria bacterium]|nr:putative peptidoglycan glycosyltransferase FtsW [Alphaproteobacteria bacterium]
MSGFARTDTSVIGRWWWTVDRWTLGALAILVAFGALLTLTASPSVADKLGYDSFYFVRRQFVLIFPAAFILASVSLLSPKEVYRLAVVVFIGSMVLLVMTPFFGEEHNGAQRWISLGWSGLSLQPSEFVKPSFVVIAAWMFAQTRLEKVSTGNFLVGGLLLLVISLLLMQPDFGMAVVISAVWFTQFFLAGLPLAWAAVLTVVASGGLVASYFLFPHVAGRIDHFLDPASGDSYQITTSMEAFVHGGLTGRGPGEGTIKEILPDAHADFIFAVAGEEFGLLACLAIVGLFVFVIVRSFSRLTEENSLFVLLAGTGLLVQFGLQAVINIASSLHLIPTKGMTLPFISYGGSSLTALSLGMGMVLALTRRRTGLGKTP